MAQFFGVNKTLTASICGENRQRISITCFWLNSRPIESK